MFNIKGNDNCTILETFISPQQNIYVYSLSDLI